MVFVVIGLATGVTLWATGQQTAIAITAFLVVGVVIVTTAIGMIRDLMRGHCGLDVLAVTAMVAALACCGRSPSRLASLIAPVPHGGPG